MVLQVRETMIHLILMDEQPFMMIKHVGFNFFCQVLQPLYKKIAKKQAKADYQRVLMLKRED